MRTILPLIALASLTACPPGDDTAKLDDTDAPDEGGFTMTLTLGYPDVGTSPLEGATVALDDGAGSRTEVVSDAEGVVSIPVDWSLGPVNVTVDPGVAGLELRSHMGLTEADDGMLIEYSDDSLIGEQVGLYGVVADLTPDFRLQVSTLGGAGTMDGSADGEWAVEVLPDTDVELMALEYRELPDGASSRGYAYELSNWTLLPVDGVSVDTEVDLVLTGDQDPSTFETRVLFPDDSSDAVYGSETRVLAQVYEQRGGQVANLCGLPVVVDISEDGASLELEGAYLPGTTAEDIVVFTEAYDPSGGYFLMDSSPGSPDEWAEEPQFLPIPTDVQLDANDVGTWTASVADPGVEADLELWMVDPGNNVRWVVFGDGISVVVPSPPSSTDAEVLIPEITSVITALADRVSGVDVALSHGPRVTP